MDIEVECDICKKTVKVKSMKITAKGRVYLALKCGHYTGFLFAGIIYPRPVIRGKGFTE